MLVVGYLVSHWKIDSQKVAAMIAAAQGLEPAGTSAAAVPEPEPVSKEQVSFEQILEARALKDKNLQLRELALTNTLAQLRTDRQKLADELKRYQDQRRDYETKLDATTKGAQAAGRTEVSSLLQSLKPKQAKEIVLKMLENSETEEVVMLLSGMTEAKRAKILGEFKTPDETKKIDEVIRLIRQGVPTATIAEQARQQLPPPGPRAP
jgi:hypothetical protein